MSNKTVYSFLINSLILSLLFIPIQSNDRVDRDTAQARQERAEGGDAAGVGSGHNMKWVDEHGSDDDRGKERDDEEDEWPGSEDELDGGCVPGVDHGWQQPIFDGESGDIGAAKEEWEKLFGVGQDHSSSGSPAVFVGEERTPYGTVRHYRSGDGGSGAGSVPGGVSQPAEEIKETLDDLYLGPEVQKKVDFFIRMLKHRAKTKPKKNKNLCLLLHGPSGVGKTALARILAQESGYELMEIKAPLIRTKWQGSGSQGLAEIFKVAKEKRHPVLIFIDELENIASANLADHDNERKDDKASFWLQLDGCKAYPHVAVVVATNHFDELDNIVLRRINKRVIRMGLPKDATVRGQIIELHAKREEKNIRSGTLIDLAKKTGGWSGSDLEHLVEHAVEVLECGEGDVDGALIPDDLLYEAFQEIKKNREKGWVKRACTAFSRNTSTIGAAVSILGIVSSYVYFRQQNRHTIEGLEVTNQQLMLSLEGLKTQQAGVDISQKGLAIQSAQASFFGAWGGAIKNGVVQLVVAVVIKWLTGDSPKKSA